MLGFAITIGVLYLFPIAQQGMVSIILLCVLYTLLIFQYLYSTALFKRRAFLNEAFKEYSGFKQVLWHSAFTRLFYLLFSFTLSIALLLLAAMFDSIDWIVILFMVLGYFLIDSLLRENLQKHITPQHQVSVTHRFNFVFVFVIQAAVLTALQLMYGVHTDVLNKSFTEVFQHYLTHFSADGIQIVNFALSWTATVNDFIWHATALLNSVQTPAGVKWAIVIGLVLFNAVKVTIVWYALLGLSIFTEQQYHQNWNVLGKNRLTKSFLVTILGLAIITTFIYSLASKQMNLIINQITSNNTTLHTCTEKQKQQSIQILFNELGANLDSGIEPLNQSILNTFITNLNSGFLSLEQGVNNYLDWHFSITGEYARLLAMSKNASGLWADKNHLNKLITDKMNLFYGDKSQDIIALQIHKTDNQLNSKLDEMLTKELQNFVRKTQRDPCLKTEINNSLLSFITGSNPMVGGGSIAGLSVAAAAKLANQALAKKTIGSIAAKLAAKSTAKTAAKAATASTAASAGTACGPFTVVCGTALGVGTWVGVDFAASKIDEKLNREELKAEIIDSLESQKQQLIEDFNHHLQSQTAQWSEKTVDGLKQIRNQELFN